MLFIMDIEIQDMMTTLGITFPCKYEDGYRKLYSWNIISFEKLEMGGRK